MNLGTRLQTALLDPLVETFIRTSYRILNEASRPYIRQTRERLFGLKKIEELCPDKEAASSALAAAKRQLDKVLDNLPDHGGPYFYGQEVTYPDLVVASLFMGMKTFADEEMWSQAKEWNEGKWKRLLDDFEEREYTKVY